MMGLTRKGEYAIRGMIYLARQPAGTVSLLGDIAEAVEAPPVFLAKIFQLLTKAGLVRSFRGSGGGFTLARPAVEVSLRQVVEAVEGPIVPNRCLQHSGICGRRSDCRVHDVWRAVQRRVQESLESATLAELADHKA